MNVTRADKIIAKCVEAHAMHRQHAVAFVAELLRHFLEQPGVHVGMRADEVLHQLQRPDSGWRQCTDIAQAIAAAKAGQLVLAGLSGAELGSADGHLALVIGVDGRLAGSVVVPLAYAGAPDRRAIAERRLTDTLPADVVRTQTLPYYLRAPDWEPAASALTILRAAAARPRLRRPAEAAPTPTMAWGRKVSPAFRHRLAAMAAQIGVQTDYLMAVMAWLTGASFAPNLQHQSTRATGLIQFTPATARALGTRVDSLATLSAEAQLDLVERYLLPFRGKLENLGDTCMALTWPRGVGKPDDWVLYARGDSAYREHCGLDLNQDGRVTRHEAISGAQTMLERGLRAEHYG